MHLILTGATGLVGTAVLHHILALPSTSPIAQKISRVSIISRRPQIPLLEHPDCPRQNEIPIDVLEHKDFKDYQEDGLLDKLKKSEDNQKIGVIWALGVSQTLVSKEQYEVISNVYPKETAKAFSTELDPEQLNFVYVSGEGANPNPGMLTAFFGRVKGRTETEMLELMKTEPYIKNLKVLNVRLGGVDAGYESDQKLVDQLTNTDDGGTGGKTRNSLLFAATKAVLFPVLRAGVYKGMHSPTSEMARVMVELAVGDGGPVTVKGVEAGGRTLPNIALRRLGGSVQ